MRPLLVVCLEMGWFGIRTSGALLPMTAGLLGHGVSKLFRQTKKFSFSPPYSTHQLFILLIRSSDCDVGIPLEKEECCQMIKDSVPKADLNGNFLECHYEYPIGSASNPVNLGRVCIHTDAAGIVVNIPKNE